LIKKDKAYVCDLSAEEIREYRGTLTTPGKNSPHRDRLVEENLDLFARMRTGEFPDGSRVLRAKIDMASPNLNLRDPVIYRILKASHHRTGDKWCIYPMYDFTHGLSDSIEGITHSICTLEFEDHRPLYDWFLDKLDVYHPQQIEFARLDLSYTVMSKRKLLELVREGLVSDWNDPRMPTISGLRRRGFTPESIRRFSERIGVAKKRDTVVELGVLEHAVREDLNLKAPRVMAVLRPLKVRLRAAYFIKCESLVKDDKTGEITELHCTYDPDSRGGEAKDGRKVKGTLHWVSARHAIEAEVRLYDHLFIKEEDPGNVPEGCDFKDNLNPDSLEVLKSCQLEHSLADADKGNRFQFLRHGYFCVDTVDSTKDKLVFNRTVTLRDSWAKINKASQRS